MRKNTLRLVEARTPQATLDALVNRLEEGYRRIEEAIARGEDVTAWETFWIALLHQYEEEFDNGNHDSRNG